MPYKAKSIDFDGILKEIVSRTKFLEDPIKLLGFVREDPAATAEIMLEIGIDIERVISDFYIEEVPLSQEEPEELPQEEVISEEKLKEIEAEAEEEEKREVILSHEEIEYLQGVFSRHVLTVAGLPEKEVSKIVEALKDEEYLSTEGVQQNLSDQLLPLLSSPVVKAVGKLSKTDAAEVRRLLSRRRAKKDEAEVEKEAPKAKVKEVLPEAPMKAAPEQIIAYSTFIDVVIDKSKMTKEIVLKVIGYESGLVYNIMTKLLHISPEKVGRDLLALKSKDQIENYIDEVLGQLTEENFNDLLEILKPRHAVIYSLMEELEIDLKEALKVLYSRNRKDYNLFVDRLFELYGSMLKSDALREMIFKDPIIASGVINRCDLKQEELTEIVKAHDEIALEMARLFGSYKLDHEPFKGIKYREIEKAVDGLKREIEERLKTNEEKVGFLYGIYDIGLNYELEAKRYDSCEVITQYANKSSANPYEIALRLGNKLKIPLPENFLRDMALSLAMSLKRAELVSKERFDELLEKANQYRQEEGYYEITEERKRLF